MLGKYQKDIKIKFKTFAARTLFENFRIIEKKEEQVRVVCKHCELVLKGSLYERAVFRSHLKVGFVDDWILNSNFEFWIESSDFDCENWF